jgi:hypothetical protein
LPVLAGGVFFCAHLARWRRFAWRSFGASLSDALRMTMLRVEMVEVGEQVFST